MDVIRKIYKDTKIQYPHYLERPNISVCIDTTSMAVTACSG